MFRKMALEKAGLFDERIRWSEEFDLAVRIHAAGFHLEGLEQPLVRHAAAASLGGLHPAWKLRDVAAARLRCILTRFRWRRGTVMASRVLLSVGLAGLRAGHFSPVLVAIADTLLCLPEIARNRAVVPISVEDYFFEPNEQEDEFSVPIWRKALRRLTKSG